ncbi:MAG: glycosyltransferase, partial [Gemmatimonadota bacterium]|nr:glycosyltransferase [Gemmatimonadota bacterium]
MGPSIGQSLSVGVICTAGAAHLSRCLAALRGQRNAPPFDVVVVCDTEPPGMAGVRQAFPDVTVVDSGGAGPMGLVSRALSASRGDLVLLTKDHCVPGPDWVRTMVNAQAADRAAVGGRVEAPPDASATDWAFYFVDFHSYAAPVAEGPAARLSVCNVAYRRDRLEAIGDGWRHTFVERDVHDRLAARFGSLWMCEASEVTLARPLTLRQAIAERYTYGRLFGFSRMQSWGRAKRTAYAAL